MTVIETQRLVLRPWRKEDLEPFAQLNGDPRVMEYFPAILTRQESDQMAQKVQSKIEKQGWGLWAVSEIQTGRFIGFIGLNDVDQATFPVPFSPATEIGWRLAFEHWGKGYATEGAKACVVYAFQTLGLDEIVSFTAEENHRSRKVMKRIGMHHHPKDDFENPKLPKGHPLRKHVLYRQMKKYVFKPYSQTFPNLFAKEKARISSYLKHSIIIEHIGSTAVPNLGGKGIIDIAIATDQPELDTVSKQLQSLGYEFKPSFSSKERYYFMIYLPDEEEGKRRYHIHLTYRKSTDWKALIAFRNYLITLSIIQKRPKNMAPSRNKQLLRQTMMETSTESLKATYFEKFYPKFHPYNLFHLFSICKSI